MAERRSRTVAKPKAGGDAPVGAFGPVETAVRLELGALLEDHPALLSAGMLEIAFALARRIDDPGTSSTAMSMCAGKLHEIVGDCRAAVPVQQVGPSRVDRIREKRRGGLKAV